MANGSTNGSSTGTSKGIHWIRILIGGFLAELLLILVVIPINMKFGQHPLLYVAPVGSLVTCFLFGWWVGGQIESRFLLHGVLVGVVAMLIYIGLTRAQPEPLAYVIAHVLKLVGGAGGGLLAGRRKAAA
jgi:putative membrane protein (TIGR04086 family)